MAEAGKILALPGGAVADCHVAEGTGEGISGNEALMLVENEGGAPEEEMG